MAVALAGCKGFVADPLGDASGTADLIEAGVDYRDATTELWVWFGRGNDAELVIWDVSTDGDTIPGYQAVLARDEEHSDWYVRGPGQQVVCDGRIDGPPDAGARLTIDTSCIKSPSTGRPAGTVRVRAHSFAGPTGRDSTGWTKPIVRS